MRESRAHLLPRFEPALIIQLDNCISRSRKLHFGKFNLAHSSSGSMTFYVLLHYTGMEIRSFEKTQITEPSLPFTKSPNIGVLENESEE